MLIQLRRAVTLAALAGAALAAAAQSQVAGVTSELKVWVVAGRPDGAEDLLAARTVKPGDVLQYSAIYRNAGDQPVSKLEASLPIPPGTELIDVARLPTTASASLDGHVFELLPIKRKQRRADGQWAEVVVPLSEVRYVRWPKQDLAPGDSFTTTARVRVVQSGAGASPPGR